METYLVCFILNNEEVDYDKITGRLKEFDLWARPLPNVWIVRSNEAISQIRSQLAQSINGEGRIMVIKISGASWATYDIINEVTDWMKQQV